MRETRLGPAKGRTAVLRSHARAKSRELYGALREGHSAWGVSATAGAMPFGDVADMYIAAHEAS